jgi:hypothetical protein
MPKKPHPINTAFHLLDAFSSENKHMFALWKGLLDSEII